MGNKTKRTPTEKLRLIGKLQLGSYLFILVWMTSIEIFVRFKSVDVLGQLDPWPIMWIPYAPLGLLLIPSAITFIQTDKKPNSPSTRSARTLQTILFSIVLVLTYPALALASMAFSPYNPADLGIYYPWFMPSYFVACVLGIISFPIMWKITQPLVPKTIRVSVDEYPNLIKQ